MNDLIPYQPNNAIPADTTDDLLIERWLHGRPAHTQRAYKGNVEQFLDFTGKPLQQITLFDLQDFADSLTGKPASKARILNACKSLLTFAFELGYTHFNIGKGVKPPKIPGTLAERIMSEEQIFKMLALEINPRNHAILRLFYASGIRVSELCALRWKDVLSRGDKAQISVTFGKGGEHRSVVISKETYNELRELRKGAAPSSPVFVSRGGGRGKAGASLDESSVRRIVYQARDRAGIDKRVSPHWFRHAHASHSLQNGAPIALVRDTLGHANLSTTSKYTHALPDESSGKYLKI